MGNLRGNDLRGLAWTVAGASAGGFVRHWLDPVWPSAVRSPGITFVLAAASAMLIGFAATASIRVPVKTVLIAAGGAAGSVGVAAARAAIATPVQSALGLAVFFVGAAAGVMAGRWAASFVANRKSVERC